MHEDYDNVRKTNNDENNKNNKICDSKPLENGVEEDL